LHFNYSVLGDTVNLASRLEGQTVNYGVSIVVGATTAAGAADAVAALEIDYIAVKGKTQPEHIYAVLGRADLLASESFTAFRDGHLSMLEHYRSRRFVESKALLDHWQSAYDTHGLLRVTEIYRERIAEFEREPPPAQWDGSL